MKGIAKPTCGVVWGLYATGYGRYGIKVTLGACLICVIANRATQRVRSNVVVILTESLTPVLHSLESPKPAFAPLILAYSFNSLGGDIVGTNLSSWEDDNSYCR